jgi:hypothetical protein
MRWFVALAMLLALTGTSDARTIRSGATVQVKAGTIFFAEKAMLARWQALNNAGDATARASYQKDLLRNRDAWQFTKLIAVRIREYRPATHQVDVEMTAEGRLRGTVWVLDADAIK